MSITAKELMTKKVVTVEMDDRLSMVRDIFSQAEFHHLLVTDESGKLQGVISQKDLLSAISPNIGKANQTDKDAHTLNKRVHQVMSRNPVCVLPQSSLKETTAAMLTHNVSTLAVVERDKILGIITWKDLLGYFYQQANEV